ncbi:Mdm2-binding protein [Elysia marginata]|uniref:Mdm2-binding protein n=1 Tax=Elysia marginata TaxID=1093978 RepID=A0AAV4GCE1_9GAST|nr:Mdm2-binding protein [Elysia marginata]
MGRFLIVTSNIAGSASETESNLSLFLERAKSAIKDTSHSNKVLFKEVIADSKLHKVKKIFPEDGWASLEDFSKSLNASNYGEESLEVSSDELLLADCLHDVADSLPYTGAILRVTIFDNFADSCNDGKSDHFIPLAGALRRLKEWHNGQIMLVSKTTKLHSSREDLVDFGHCQIVHNLEQIPVEIPNWEGKIAVVDRIENKGPTFTGHCLKSDVWETLLQQKVQTFTTDGPKLKGHRKRQRFNQVKLVPNEPVCGRTIEILQEVDLRTFPLFLVDSWTLSLYP